MYRIVRFHEFSLESIGHVFGRGHPKLRLWKCHGDTDLSRLDVNAQHSWYNVTLQWPEEMIFRIKRQLCPNR